MAVTQKQIAEKMGISQPLVALALRDHPRVAEKTRLLVRETALAMGYQLDANSAARALASQRHGTRPKVNVIGVLLNDLFEMGPLRDLPFMQEILQGLKAGAEERNVEISFNSTLPERLPRTITEGGVDAAVFLYCHPSNELTRQYPLSMPSLVVGDSSEGDWSLMPDNRQGIKAVTQHLIQLGHRRIAYLGSVSSNVAYDDRLAGFREAMEEAGLEYSGNLVDLDVKPIPHAGAQAFEELVGRTRDFTAVVCYNDQSALGAIRQAQKMGIRVPEDISITGFDGSDEHFAPGKSLTTVYFDRKQMGQRIVELICDAGDGTLPAHDLPSELLEVRLILGDSTQPVSLHA